MDIENDETSDMPRSGLSPDMREQLKAAAQAAIDGSAESATDPDAPTNPATPVAKSAKGEDATGEKPEGIKARVVARAREQAARIRAEVDQERQKVVQERAELERSRAELEPWRGRIARFREDPIAALEEAGMNAQEYTEKVLLHGQPDPVKEKLSPLQKELEATKQEMGKMREYLSRIEQDRQQREAETAVSKFTALAFNEEKFPTLAVMFKGKESLLIEEADFWTDRYKSKKGHYPSLEDVAEFLEEKYSNFASPQKSEGAGKTSQANGSTRRTLSNATTSQRAASPKPIHLMDPEERREHQKRIAAQAMREYSAGISKK